MATLVLNTVGRLLGLPMGGAVGALIGNVIDREVLFKPAGRDGPRLNDLAVQTSSYGTQLPRLYGTIRVAGSVIWSTDLIEHRSKSGGKGRPAVTTYSYTASFAVALSGRPVLGVGRIWADGKLLCGAAGDWKSRTGAFRLHAGGEDQAADPLIAAAEGIALAPAHRGLAYAVFEDLELADFGNRIPSLTFEVTADAGPVAAGAIAAEASGGTVTADGATQPLAGFAASGADLRAAIDTLAGADGGWFRETGGTLALTHGGAVTDIADAGFHAPGKPAARGGRSIAASDQAARTASLTYYDPARDYQIGVQRAARPGAGSREARLELPAAVSAGTAKGIAEAALARLDTERERRSVTLGWDALGLTPGACVRIAGTPGVWRVDTWTLEAMVVTLDCIAVSPGAVPAPASGGRGLPAPDRVAGATLLAAFELPPLDGSLATAPRIAVVAAGTRTGWRSAALLLSTDGGAHWDGAGGTAPPGVIGTILVAPGRAGSAIEDRTNEIEVALAHDAMVLGDADRTALAMGANLAMAGDELLQFARAEPLGANRWRLGGLWRGRFGTEAAAGAQAPGDRFVLISADSLATIDLPLSALGGTALLQGEGVGDNAGPAEADAVLTGFSVTPPSPVHGRYEAMPDGTTRVTWVRRSRAGWRWIDGADSPLGEEAERYRVTIAPEDGPARIAETGSPEISIAPGERTGLCAVTIRQAGSFGLSPPLELILPPGESA